MVIDWRVTIIPEAYADIGLIDDYITEAVSVGRSIEVTMGLLELARGLTTFPLRHEIIPEPWNDARTIHKLPKWSYLIIYRVDEKKAEIAVLGFFSSCRDPAALTEVLTRTP